MKRVIVAIVLVLLAVTGIAMAEEKPWKDEFKRLCNFTDVVSRLSDEELQELVKDSNDLLVRLKEVKAPEAKVYIFRLKKCRNMYQYTLDMRAAKANRKAGPQE